MNKRQQNLKRNLHLAKLLQEDEVSFLKLRRLLTVKAPGGPARARRPVGEDVAVHNQLVILKGDGGKKERQERQEK